MIYVLDEADVQKQRGAQHWRSALWKTRRGRVSFQVLQEFYVTVVKKWPVARSKARAEVRDLLAWRPIALETDILEQAWRLEDRYHLSFWDALIVAAPRSISCKYLLSGRFPA